jgi:PSP1 C-terminal conserved region
MTVFDAEFQFDHNKLTFFYQADKYVHLHAYVNHMRDIAICLLRSAAQALQLCSSIAAVSSFHTRRRLISWTMQRLARMYGFCSYAPH